MKNLVQHIESLIIKHECVIVPGLGGFLTYRDSAVIHNNRLYAPSQQIRFNSLLSYHDGLLAEAYMNDRHISYTEALEAITTDINQIKNTLLAGNIFIFGRIGTLSILNDKIVLRHNDCSFLPENIGLPVVQLKQLSEKKSGNSVVINIPRATTNTLRYVAMIAVVFLIALFVPNQISDTRNYASLSFDTLRNIQIPECNSSKVHFTANKAKQIEKQVLATDSSNTKEVEEETICLVKEPEPIKQEDRYHLIIASLTSLKDAEKYIANHKIFDQAQLRIHQCDNKYRISAKSFSKYKEALEYADSIRNLDQKTKNVWVLCK